PEAFCDAGEAAHVAEQNGHRARLAAQLQAVRLAGELLDKLWCKILAECAADAGPPLLLAEVIDGGKQQEDNRARNERIDDIYQNAGADEEIAGENPEQCDNRNSKENCSEGAKQRHDDDDTDPDGKGEADFEP